MLVCGVSRGCACVRAHSICSWGSERFVFSLYGKLVPPCPGVSYQFVINGASLAHSSSEKVQTEEKQGSRVEQSRAATASKCAHQHTDNLKMHHRLANCTARNRDCRHEPPKEHFVERPSNSGSPGGTPSESICFDTTWYPPAGVRRGRRCGPTGSPHRRMSSRNASASG